MRGSRLGPATMVFVPLLRYASYLEPISFELTVIASSSSSLGGSDEYDRDCPLPFRFLYSSRLTREPVSERLMPS